MQYETIIEMLRAYEWLTDRRNFKQIQTIIKNCSSPDGYEASLARFVEDRFRRIQYENTNDVNQPDSHYSHWYRLLVDYDKWLVTDFFEGHEQELSQCETLEEMIPIAMNYFYSLT